MMNRRGFFDSVAKFFQSRDTTEVFFGLQVAIRTFPGSDLRRRFHECIAAGDEVETPRTKEARQRGLVTLLLEEYPTVEYCYWDYVPDANEAAKQFDTWVHDIQGSVALYESETTDHAEDIYRLSSEQYFNVVTVMFLTQGTVPALHSIIESFEKDELYLRDNLRRMIEALLTVDYHDVLGSAAFIVPGNEEDGFSWEDLHGEGWNYLRPVS